MSFSEVGSSETLVGWDLSGQVGLSGSYVGLISFGNMIICHVLIFFLIIIIYILRPISPSLLRQYSFQTLVTTILLFTSITPTSLDFATSEDAQTLSSCALVYLIWHKIVFQVNPCCYNLMRFHLSLYPCNIPSVSKPIFISIPTSIYLSLSLILFIHWWTLRVIPYLGC